MFLFKLQGGGGARDAARPASGCRHTPVPRCRHSTLGCRHTGLGRRHTGLGVPPHRSRGAATPPSGTATPASGCLPTPAPGRLHAPVVMCNYLHTKHLQNFSKSNPGAPVEPLRGNADNAFLASQIPAPLQVHQPVPLCAKMADFDATLPMARTVIHTLSPLQPDYAVSRSLAASV